MLRFLAFVHGAAGAGACLYFVSLASYNDQWWAFAVAAPVEGGTMVAILLSLAELLDRPLQQAVAAIDFVPAVSDPQSQTLLERLGA